MPIWTVIPFLILLLLVAAGHFLLKRIWHHYYPHISLGLGGLVFLYYAFAKGDLIRPVISLSEYFSFIAIAVALFVIAGSIHIEVDREGKPLVNVVLLLIGAVAANVIGTTGASMLLIRPFIRMNKNRLRIYHVVFFIFIVSNVGGGLTPIGDPPLFLGFLKGIPFFWTVKALFLSWVFTLGLLLGIFWFIDRKNHLDYDGPEQQTAYSNRVVITGGKNFIYIVLLIFAIFLDPDIFPWVPSVKVMGNGFSVLRELALLGIAFLCYKTTPSRIFRNNNFNFEPIREVVFIFAGLFLTMTPAMQLIEEYSSSSAGEALINHHTLYWGTGLLSSLLDNAPTYLNFLAASLAKNNLNIENKSELLLYLNNEPKSLISISLGAVFFGAMTYIGNGPNFMVKTISEQSGLVMPSFGKYILHYSLPVLLPVLFILWVVFILIF